MDFFLEPDDAFILEGFGLLQHFICAGSYFHAFESVSFVLNFVLDYLWAKKLMQEVFCYFIGILVAAGVTAMIAFPHFFVPEDKRKKKRFTARHWGNYHGSKVSADCDQNEGIEVGIPAKKICHVVGSSTYSGGRGK